MGYSLPEWQSVQQSPSGTTPQKLRQTDDHWGNPSGLVAWNTCSSVGCLSSLRNDCRQPVGQLWLAGIIPGLMMATLFVIYIYLRCKLNPSLGPALPDDERKVPLKEKLNLLKAGLLPVFIFAAMMIPFVNGWTSLVKLCGRRNHSIHCCHYQRAHDKNCV